MIDIEGILTICTYANIAPSGAMPIEQLQPKCTAYYRKRTVGYNRLYAAMGASQQIDMLVRITYTELPAYGEQWYAVFEDGSQFRVSAVQEIVEEGCIDLTLVRLEALYDVNEQ
jgi:hypothetical protein